MIRILELQRRIAELICIRKHIGRIIGAYSTQALDVACASCNDISRCFRVVEACGVGNIVVDGVETLGVVNMAEHSEVDAVFVEERFKGCLAWAADVFGVAGRVPGSVAGDDYPGSDGAIDRCQVSVEELQLLGWCAAKGTGAESSTTALAIGCRGEVGLCVDHHDVGHAVLKRIPEGWVG